MHKKVSPDRERVQHHIGQFPHCDQRILHAPGECQYCDHHPDWQALRIAWGIAFTGYEPDEKELPCPADHARGDSHQQWVGNKPAFLSGMTVEPPPCTCGTTIVCPRHTQRGL